MRKEMHTLAENDTWDLVPTSESTAKPIGCSWVYKVKHNVDATINLLKAQLIAKG